MPARRILVLNTGSSTLKWVLLDATNEAVLDRGETTWRDAEPDRHADELAETLRGIEHVDAVGHRVVHGGPDFRAATLIDDAVRDRILELAPLAPLHNPAAVAGIDAARLRFPDAPQVATFDTAFHTSIPDHAALYAVPWEWTERWRLRRFGFHGLSVEYAISRAAEIAGSPVPRLVVCHLGAGCSVTAVSHARSIDTSMGFTPLEGLVMARRSGSVDPGMLLYLLRTMDVASVDRALNEQSGLLGVSGVSVDMREVLAAAAAGNPRATLARDMFVYRVVTCIGSMAAALGGLDSVVFTGGIGTHSSEIRRAVCGRLAYLGIGVDDRTDHGVDRDIASPESRVRVLVIGAREDLSVMRETVRLITSLS